MCWIAGISSRKKSCVTCATHVLPTGLRMASITPHSRGGYRAQVYVRGARDSQVFPTKRQAEAWAAARETELRNLADMPKSATHTFGDALRKYRDEVSPTKRSKKWETTRINYLLDQPLLHTNKPIGEITPALLGIWRDHRLKVVHAGTVLRDMGLISAVLSEARREWQWISGNPAEDVRRPRAPDHREVVISRQQVRIMLGEMGYSPRKPVRSVSQACAVSFLIALRTGMRAGEICGLTWDRVHDGYCRTPHKVGRTAASLRDVPLTPKAMALIEKMRGYDPKLVVGLNASSLDANFRKYRKRAGLDGFTFHDSRHTAATWIAARMKSNGLPAQQALLDLCKMFGWSKLDQALTYYNPSAADIAKRIS